MIIKPLLTLVLSTFFLLSGSVADAVAERGDWQNGKRDGKSWHEYKKSKGHKSFLADLDLNPEQKDKLKNLMHSRAKHMETGKKLYEARNELNRLLRSSESQEADIRTQASTVNQLMITLNAQRLDHLLEMKKVLRPEQFERVVNKISHFQKHGGHHGERYSKFKETHEKEKDADSEE